MELVGRFSGGAPTIKRYQVSASLTRLGIPLLATAASEAGLDVATTTAAANFMGVNMDLATYATAQGASSPEALTSICVDPDQILQIYMSGTTASGGAALTKTVTTASTDGLNVTTNDAWNSPDYDEGSVWGVTGANAGQLRKITSTSGTAGTVTVAFRYDTAVGDTFMWAPIWHTSAQTITLTTELDEFRQNTATATNTAPFYLIELNPNWWLNTGANARPFGLFTPGDHLYS